MFAVEELTQSLASLQLAVQKNDFIVWMHLSEEQLRIYEAFIDSPDVREALNSTRSPLAALQVLKKVTRDREVCDSELLGCCRNRFVTILACCRRR